MGILDPPKSYLLFCSTGILIGLSVPLVFGKTTKYVAINNAAISVMDNNIALCLR